MRIVVLGSAAGGGFPQWNSNGPGCRRARSGDPAAKPRTQSSIAVSADGERWMLLNASPDLRLQIEATPVLHPRHGIRHSPIAAVMPTNADIDHVTGLLTLREAHPFAVYATRRVHDVLADNSVFNVLNRDLVERRVVTLGEPFRPADRSGAPLGLEIEAFAVPGKVALYLEDETAANFGSVAEDTVALRISEPGSDKALFYIPGCASMPGWLADRLTGADMVFFDGTTWTDDEMARAGAGTKTAQRMGHMCMDGPDGSIAAFADLGVKRRIFIHINNTNPVLLEDTAQRRQANAAGWDIAYDGMEETL